MRTSSVIVVLLASFYHNGQLDRSSKEFAAKAILEFGIEEPFYRSNASAIVNVCSAALEVEKDNRKILQLREKRGYAFLLLGDLDRCKEDFQFLLKQEPNNVVFQWKMGYLLGLTSLDEGKKSLERTIKQNPKFGKALASLGAIKVAQGDLKGGLKDLDEAIHLDPAYALAFLTRGQALATLGKLEFALKDLNQAIELQPFCAGRAGACYSIRGRILTAMGDHGRAANDFTVAQALDPSYFPPFQGLWEVNRLLGRYHRCALDADAMCKRFPKESRSHLARCTSLLIIGDAEEGISAGKIALSLDQKNPDVVRELALGYFFSGEYQTALDYVNKALEIDPAHAKALHSKIVILATCEDKQFRHGAKAIQLAKKFEAMNKGTSDGLFLFAISHAECGDYKKAVKATTDYLRTQRTETIQGLLQPILKGFRNGRPLRLGSGKVNPLVF